MILWGSGESHALLYRWMACGWGDGKDGSWLMLLVLLRLLLLLDVDVMWCGS